MIALDLVEIARQQNDADYAAGKMADRHCEDETILRQLAAALAKVEGEASDAA